MRLTDEIIIKCLSPSHDEIYKYQKIVSLEPDKNKKEASRGANYLSTVFQLQVGDSFVLFTSDAEILTFERLKTKNFDLISKGEYHLIQLPHHGSEKNYYQEFWKVINKKEKRYAIASAGQHHHYNHPNFEVLQEFYNDGFEIHCTNIINGMSDYVERLKQTSMTLDTVSTLAEEYIINGDRKFEITVT